METGQPRSRSEMEVIHRALERSRTDLAEERAARRWADEAWFENEANE